MSMPNMGGVPLSMLDPKFLHTNSTSHIWPFSAIAELIDNAYDPDVMANKFWIDWTRIKGFDCLTFQDNGKGMTKNGMHKMLSFGFSDKKAVRGHAPVGMYGNGFKSSSMRLGKDTIVFSKIRDTMSVGLLSQSYLESVQAEHVVVPIATIRHDGQSPLEDAASLQHILKHSPFNTEEELLTELRAITSISSTGTRIIIWNLRRGVNGETEFDLSTDRYDIRIPTDACETHKNQNITQSVSPIIYSLCAYCTYLYLKPRMQIIIRGQKVKTELISKSLALTHKDKYKPVFLKERIPITFGYTIDKDQYGMMMYHKNRLIKAFERVGCQRKGGQQGVGVIGVIECNYLQPTHNKQDFDDTDEYRKTMKKLAEKLKEYWDEIQFKRKDCLQRTEDTVMCPDQNWVQCDDCQKWRRLPDGINRGRLPDKWFCRFNPDPQYRSCQAEEEPEDSEDEQQCDPKPYKRLKKMSKMQEKKEQQQMSAPALPLPATPLSDSEQWRPAEGAPTGRSSESFTHPSSSGQTLPSDTMPMDCEDNVSRTPGRKINSKMQQKKARQQSCQMSAPDRQFTATPLSSSEWWRPVEGAPTGHSSRSFTHSSYSGQNLPCETMLMDYEDHVFTTPERVKQVPPPAVGVSSIYTKEMELASPHMIPASIQKTIQEEKKQLKSWMKEAFKNKGLGKPPHAVRENTKQTMPSLPAMHSASAQVTIKKEETQGESWVEKACENKGMVKVLEGNGPQSPMLEVPQQPDGLLDTYKEQVNQLQQELEEMKRRCEHLQVMEIELQRRKAEEPPATHRPSSAHLCPYASLVRD